IFDLSKAAFPYDEDNFGSQEVAIGPCPRSVFFRPTWHEATWIGDELVFQVFAPICAVWRHQHEFAAPARWRDSSSLWIHSWI
ncbi:MAG TPA: hypothetical protein VMB21_04040, partial [Candidatus Limnocylindria bacterium]|nr:hypothetical protein [Candidatus Limnocylindria bacterium]